MTWKLSCALFLASAVSVQAASPTFTYWANGLWSSPLATLTSDAPDQPAEQMPARLIFTRLKSLGNHTWQSEDLCTMEVTIPLYDLSKQDHGVFKGASYTCQTPEGSRLLAFSILVRDTREATRGQYLGLVFGNPGPNGNVQATSFETADANLKSMGLHVVQPMPAASNPNQDFFAARLSTVTLAK